MIKKLLPLIPLLLCAHSAMAQTTRTSATCNIADVQPLATASANGDTVVINNVPSTGCTWSTVGLVVPAGIGITITGVGAPNSLPTQFGASGSCQQTIITDALTGGRTLISMTPSAAASTPAATSRLSCMRINPTVPSTGYNNPLMVVGTCTISTCPNLRLDNLYFPTTWVQQPILVSDNTMVVKSNVFGVGDHNTVGDALAPSGSGIDFINENNGNYLAVGTWGDNTWAQPDVAGGFQSFYLENNQLLNSFLTDTDTSGASFGGGRFVCRFNQVTSINTTSGICANHGTDTNGRNRGGRIFEAYYNTGTCTVDGFGTTGCGSTWPGRSSTGIIFGNTFTNGTGGNLKSMANIDNQRRWRTNSTWGLCDGSSPWDANDTNGGGGNTAFVYFTGTVLSFSVTGPGSQELLVTVNGSPGWSTNQWAPTGAPWSMHDSTHTGGAEINFNSANSLTLNVPDQHNSSLANIANGDTVVIQRSFSCMDQAGRGQGLLVTGPVNGTSPVLQSTGAPGNVSEVLDPVYEGGDSLPAGAANTIASDTNSLIANRDFYRESVNQTAQTSATSPFNGTSGTGHGSCGTPCGGAGSQFRPTTCTTGVGYFATDVGTWDTSGGGHKGQLYKCTSTNTWNLYWTPGTYPHPLINNTPTPNASFSPSSINFGSLIVGTTSNPQTITITNTGTANLTWATYSTSQPGNTTFADTHTGTCPVASVGGIAPSASCTVILTGETNNVGVQNGSFNFPSNAPGSPQTVPLSITGVTGPITASPNPVNFGGQTVGTTSGGHVVTITNGSGVTLTMTGNALVTGTNFGIVAGSNCTGTLTNGNICTITTTFSPLTPTVLSDTLQVSFTGAAGSPLNVSLLGTGLPSTVTSPATQLFAINLASCLPATPPTTVFCMTQDGGMYVSVCGDTSCAAYSPVGVSSLSVNGSPAHKGNVRVTVNASSSTGSN